jgi:protein-L-isoaspartate(D-aspartate) O-methyltransferase
VSFFLAGGFPMVFVLVFGGVAILSAARYALAPAARGAGPTLAYCGAVACVSIAGTAVDLVAVARTIATPAARRRRAGDVPGGRRLRGVVTADPRVLAGGGRAVGDRGGRAAGGGVSEAHLAAARRRGVGEGLLRALAAVERRLFVEAPDDVVDQDGPAPLGGGHHQAEPSFLAWMAELAGVGPGRSAVVLGAGAGYLVALAGSAGADAAGVERDDALAAKARARGLRVETGDAWAWAPARPVDAVLVGAAVSTVERWLDHLAPGGVLVAPVGDERRQELVSWTRSPWGFDRRGHGAVRFEPMGRSGDGAGHVR